MKSLWTVLSIMAVANLLAVGGLVGWLASSERIDEARLERVREIFIETIPEQEAREAREEQEAKERAESEQAQALPVGMPVSSGEVLAMRLEASEIDLQRIQRLRREVNDLKASLARERSLLEQDRAGFQKERDEFEAMRERLREMEGDQQFRKALSVLESMKPDQSKATLEALLLAGKEDEVVSYLDKMQDRVRAKVVAEFVKAEDEQLAAQLLERLRLQGLAAADAAPMGATEVP